MSEQNKPLAGPVGDVEVAESAAVTVRGDAACSRLPKMRLREIPFGPCGDADEVCIYTNGHINPATFLAAVRTMQGSDVPEDARKALTVADVQHIRFRPMSPSEARSMGYDYGVMETTVRGYPVTAVKL